MLKKKNQRAREMNQPQLATSTISLDRNYGP